MSASTPCSKRIPYGFRDSHISYAGNRGAILIVLLVGLLAVSGVVLVEMAEANRQKQSNRQLTAETLAFAKEALMAYAVTYADNYGHNIRGGAGRLPCPARSKHGGPGLSCGKGNTGYLPAVWSRGKKRIDIDHIEKFLDKDLWYSVSPTFRYNPSHNALNPDSQSDLISIDGADDVVAVIIAPGPPLPGQSRVGEDAGIADYLEGENANQDLKFVIEGFETNATVSSPFGINGNDQLVWIRHAELMSLVEKRVLGYVKQWLNEYYLEYGHYPYAAPFEDVNGDCQTGLLAGRLPMAPGDCGEPSLGEFVSESVAKSRTLDDIWFTGSRWPDYIFYQVHPGCTASGPVNETTESCAGPTDELIVNGDVTKVLLVSAGESIELATEGRMQSRLPEQRAWIEYFEWPDLLSGNTEFDAGGMTDVSNDQYAVIQ